jgi:hypothetical protein
MSARVELLLALLAAALLATGCAHGGKGQLIESQASPAPTDSATAAVWHMDETGGTRVVDAGPYHLNGRAGVDTRTDFGRIGKGRVFTRSIDSWVYVPYTDLLETPAGFTIEAWVNPSSFTTYELTPIVERWTTRPGEQSWVLALTGQNLDPSFQNPPGPGTFASVTLGGSPGFVVFGFQTQDAGPIQRFASSTPLQLGRWTHVAVTFDGKILCIYLDGRIDSQYAVAGRIRESRAPLMIGNYVDWRWLSDFGGDLRANAPTDDNPYYAFDGLIDDVRLSLVARTEFPHAGYTVTRLPAAPAPTKK